MEATKTVELADRIATIAVRLQRDVETKSQDEPLLTEIRALRHSLNTLEYELHGQAGSSRGDAC